MILRKKMVVAALWLAVPVFLLAASKNKDLTVKYAVKTLAGRPLSNATVKTAYRYVSTNPYGKRTREVEAVTDQRGQAMTKGETYGFVRFEVCAPRFYSSSCTRVARVASLNEKVVLRPIQKPVPMAAVREFKKKVPVLGQALGFDLMKLDWMPPHGDGEHQDVLITARASWSSPEEYGSTLSIEFVDLNCGFSKMKNRVDEVRSQLRSDYVAPFGGYQKVAVFEDNMNVLAKTKYAYMDVQYFRIRATTAKAAVYGKIYGDQLKMTKDGPVLVFPYFFLSPTPGSRNIEFDPIQNVASEYFPALSAGHFDVDIP
jgi:hypothetical protein